MFLQIAAVAALIPSMTFTIVVVENQQPAGVCFLREKRNAIPDGSCRTVLTASTHPVNDKPRTHSRSER